MESCCLKRYERTFDLKLAHRELQSYLKKGVKRSSLPLVRSLSQLPLEGKTLLDIGGGIGILSFELLKKNISRSTHVDISPSNISIFEEETRRRSISDEVQIFQGDFVEVFSEIDTADLVTLDKVICCYEDFEQLVSKSVAKSERWYAISIPRDVWWVRFGLRMARVIQRYRGQLLPFIHSRAKIEEIIQSHGFEKSHELSKWEWMYLLYEKTNARAA